MTKEELKQKAEEYANNNNTTISCDCNYYESKDDLKDAYLAGAEFGYNKAFVEADKNLKAAVADFNKANEWHYLKDGDLPKENKLYFVAIKDNGLAIAYFNGQYWETKFNLGDFGHCVETVIAWCEIPKYTEE